jgi:adenylate cyclase
LKDVDQSVEMPPWIGREVTAQPQYYNSFLVQQPFSAWSLRAQSMTRFA